jgi:endonuclease/exonuclease/phosphatase family metal-dependent hydrolase
LVGDQFTILTWNICGLEGGFGLSTGGVGGWKERIDAILKVIRERNPDIVVLQEVQSFDLSCALYRRLKDLFSHCYYNLGIHPVKSQSGLMVFSKFAGDFSYCPFKDAAGWARGECKGVASMVIGQRLRLCFTHLQFGADGALEAARVREKQLGAIVQLIESSSLPAILAGDLNLDRGGKEFGSSSLFSRFAIHNDPSPTWTSFFVRKMWRGDTHPRKLEKCIDYIASYRRGGEENSFAIQTERIEGYNTEKDLLPLSDHHALLAKVIFVS